MKVETETGVFLVGNYSIEPRLTWRELEIRYPDAVLQHVPQSETSPRTYLLTSFEFQGHQLQVQLIFYSPYLSIVNISRIYDEQRDDPDFWTSKLVHWTKTAHTWLQSQLGKPHQTMPGELYDEKEHLAPEDVRALRSWEYIFTWGRAGYYFDSIQQPGEIFIHPDYLQKIRNWDELLEEYETPSTLHRYGGSAEVIALVKAAIHEIHKHFDYLQVRPRAMGDGVLFDLKQWSHWEYPTWVSIEVDLLSGQGSYCLSRSDMSEKAYTSDLQELVERLREYISAKP